MPISNEQAAHLLAQCIAELLTPGKVCITRDEVHFGIRTVGRDEGGWPLKEHDGLVTLVLSWQRLDDKEG